MTFFTRLAKQAPHRGTAIAHVQLWHFVASVEQALTPTLRGVPFAVVSSLRHTGVVVDVNELARALGVRPGTSVQRLRNRFSNVQLRLHHPERMQGFIRAFRKQARTWGHLLSASTDGHAVTVLIPAVSGFERAGVFLQIQADCWKELECNVMVGMGSSPAFALLAARTCAEPSYRYLDQNEHQALNTLPVSALPRIGRRTAHALVQLNVPTVYHFLKLAPETIEHLGGRSLLRIYHQYVLTAQTLPLPAGLPVSTPFLGPRVLGLASA